MAYYGVRGGGCSIDFAWRQSVLRLLPIITNFQTMGHLRPRYNKARQEQMDARRAGKRKAENQDEVAGDTEVMIPRTAAEKARDRAARELEAQVCSPPLSPQACD